MPPARMNSVSQPPHRGFISGAYSGRCARRPAFMFFERPFILPCGFSLAKANDVSIKMNQLQIRRPKKLSARDIFPHFDRQPGTGISPPLLGGGRGNPERRSGLLKIQADEITQLYQFRLARIHGGKLFQGFVQGQQPVIIRDGRRNFEFVQFNRHDTCAPFHRQSPPGMLDQDAPHGLGSRAEEMRAILKRRRLVPAQPQPRFVDEGSWLERVTGGFAGHFLRRQPAQFIINQGKQFRSR